MKVFIAGIDGYLGWPLALHLASRGHQIMGMDCYLRRDWVEEMGSQSALPIRSMTERRQTFQKRFGAPLRFDEGSARSLWASARITKRRTSVRCCDPSWSRPAKDF